MENSVGEWGLAILEFGGQGGDEHFGISEGKGGVKMLMPPVVGHGYFWNHPMIIFIYNYSTSLITNTPFQEV